MSNMVDDYTEKPRWVPIASLKAEDFQHGGEIVLAFCCGQITGSPDEAGASIKGI